MNLLKTTVALTSILALSSCGVAEAIEGAIQDEVDARNTARTAVVNTVGGTETASSAAFVEKSDSEDDDSDEDLNGKLNYHYEEVVSFKKDAGKLRNSDTDSGNNIDTERDNWENIQLFESKENIDRKEKAIGYRGT